MTYREACGQAAGNLCGAGIEYADTESRLLMEYVCQADLNFYLLHADEEMPEELRERYEALIRERCGHVPLQHLTGEQEFMGIPIGVNDRVLIPRQDTEILAEEAVGIVRDLTGDLPEVRVLDLCTGSGCIAIAIKSFCPEALVYGSDISGDAIKTAAANAARSGVEVEWIKSDLFSETDGHLPGGQCDMIVSNPPYIPTEVLDTLAIEVRDHEPRAALDGGPDGLDYYRKIIDACGSCARTEYSEKCTDELPVHRNESPLRPGGILMFEIGSDQADKVTSLMAANGFEEICVTRDLSGLDRVVKGRLRTRP